MVFKYNCCFCPMYFPIRSYLRQAQFQTQSTGYRYPVFIFTLLLTGDRTREKMIFLSTAVCLWVMLRSILKEYPPLRMLFLMIAIYTGVTQSIWGSMQLYGLVPAEHIFIKLTGLSIDPVQLSGYTIVITPIVFGMLLKLHNCNKSAWWQVRTAIYYFPGSVSFLF